MTIEILGGKRKSRFNPDLGNQVNKEFERAKARGELDKMFRKPDEWAVGVYTVFTEYITSYLQKYPTGIPFGLVAKLKPTKEKIKLFTQDLVNYDSLLKDKDYFLRILNLTGNFLTALMMTSQERSFELDFRELNTKLGEYHLHYIGIKLDGRSVTVQGDVGDSLGNSAEKCTFTTMYEVGDTLARKANDCVFRIDGKVEEGVAEDSENCELYLKGGFGWDQLEDNSLNQGTKIYVPKGNRWVDFETQ